MIAHVVVLGDIVTDVVVRPQASVAADSDTESLIRQGIGGAGANVAAWLAWCGVRVRLIGQIGDDAVGRAHASALAARGIDTRLAVHPDLPTGTVVVLVDESGGRTMFPDRGANLGLDAGAMTGDLVDGASHLHVSGYALLHPRPRPAALAAITLARERGMTVSVDPSSVAPLLESGVSSFLDWTRDVDICLANLAEAELLSGRRGASASARALAAFYGEVVVTAGGEGALWSDGTEVIASPALDATVADTTGAGDAFTAGYLSGRLGGGPVDHALSVGHRTAACAVERTGGEPPRGAIDRV